jgi:hypothetical protein
MESQQTENFNERLSQWVSNQGFWFQLRYSMSGKGVRGQAMYHLLRMTARLMIFLLLIAVGFWIYLMNRPGTGQFFNEISNNLKSALSASELEISAVQHAQGQLEIARLGAQGGEDTFFDSLEARNIRAKMRMLDGLLGVWETGNITISRLEVDLRAGTNDPQSAMKLAETVFHKSGKVEANSFEVADATIRWGYSERTRGAIESSQLRIQRTGTGWRLAFSGGTFSQNWLRQLQIESLVVVVDSGGFVFERAVLKGRAGSVEFPGLRLMGGERPEIAGIVKIRSLPLERVIPPSLHNFIEGSISGDFKVSGSTNTSEGIGFEGQVVMDGSDFITLRDRIHLLKALSVVDYSRKYHRVDFREGSFEIKTGHGGMHLTGIDLKSDDFSLQGAFNVRLPTQQEVDEAVAKGTGLSNSPLFAEDDLKDISPPAGETDFTLRRAAQEARRIREGAQSPDSLNLFDRLGLSIEMRRLQIQAAERMSRMLRYEGMLQITIPGDAFERAPRLQEIYPADAATGRVAMRVPIQGHLYELTLRQAEDVYQQGQR